MQIGRDVERRPDIEGIEEEMSERDHREVAVVHDAEERIAQVGEFWRHAGRELFRREENYERNERGGACEEYAVVGVRVCEKRAHKERRDEHSEIPRRDEECPHAPGRPFFGNGRLQEEVELIGEERLERDGQ